MTAAPLPAELPTPRHAAPEESLPASEDSPRHRAAGNEGAHLRIAPHDERARRGRHAAPDAEEPAEDPLAWLGFRFESA
jgi:hypothetical protein